MLQPYIYKKNIKKGQRIAIEGVVLEETKDDRFLIGFYPDTKANILEINGDRVYPIKKKEFLYSTREDIPSEIKTKKFENLLIELREAIDENYCFENEIDYNLGALCSSPIEILCHAIDFIKKTQQKEKE